MTILDLVTIPDPLLRKKSISVDLVDDAIRSLMDDMVETMYHDQGVGLAAVQIGVLKRIIVVDIDDRDKEFKLPDGFFPLKMVNPEITKYSETQCSLTEGCLSVPGEFLEVTRPDFVEVKYLNENGESKTVECHGWFARVIQHELDHLDGKLLVDYMSSVKRDIVVRKLTKAKRHA